MVPQEDWDVVRKQASRILSGHDPQQIEHRILQKDGIIRWVRNTPVLHYDIQGNLISYEGLIRDITERKRAEEALRESEERLRSFMDSATDSFSIWDSELNLVDINTVGMEMFQTVTKRADIIGKSMLDLVPDTKETGRYNWYMEVLRTGEPFFEETLVPHPKLGDIHLAVKTFKVGYGLGVIATDITDQKKFQQLQERFIASTSHELRTPVTVLMGYIDFLRKNPDQPVSKVEQIYQRLHSNVTRLSRLIENVHVLAKITQDVFKASPRQTALEDFIRTIQEQILILYPNRSIIMNYMPYSNTTPILIDQDGILQVLHNLINNAIKNSPQTSVVEITAVRHAREVRFTVQDYGVGISLPNFFQLFRPFTPLDTQYSVSGTGLGLYIVKSIVLAHGGSVEVHSKEHCGSSFTITLPTS